MGQTLHFAIVFTNGGKLTSKKLKAETGGFACRKT
jgi:hypothetical protein